MGAIAHDGRAGAAGEAPVRAWRTPPIESEKRESLGAAGLFSRWMEKILYLDVALYAIRDTLTGSVRYYMDMYHLSSLWFFPDILAFLIFGYFCYVAIVINKSIPAVILVVNFFAAMVIGAIYMNQSSLAFVTGIKAVIPLFVGMAFFDRSMTAKRYCRIVLFTMMVISTIGLLFAPYVDYPWVGAEISNFGFEKTVGKLWWDGGVIRYGGFAGDSTMAAFMVIFPYFLLHRHIPHWANILLWPVLFYALDISTSKTASGVLGAFVVYYLVTYFLIPAARRLEFQKGLALSSYLLVLLPIVMIFVLGGAKLDVDYPSLFSLQDRIDNSWQKPFTYLSQTYPAGLLTGCGLGCFSYPMTYTVMAGYFVPVDNFYITTYLFFGFPFLLLVIAQVFSVRRIADETKLALILLLNIYTITVACYGPSFATIMAGYAFSLLFAKPEWRRFSRARRAPAAPVPQAPVTSGGGPTRERGHG
jgi:hypothetical protein